MGVHAQARIVSLALLLTACVTAPAIDPEMSASITDIRVQQERARADRAERLEALEYWRAVRRIERLGQIEQSLLRVAEPALLLTFLLSCAVWIVTLARVGVGLADFLGLVVARRLREMRSAELSSPQRESPDMDDELRREALRQACLVFLFQADRLREASGGKETGLSERSMVKAGIVTGPAWEKVTGVLVEVGVLQKRGGVTDYGPEYRTTGYEGARAFLSDATRLPFPSGRVPRVEQPFGNAPHRAAPHRTAP